MNVNGKYSTSMCIKSCQCFLGTMPSPNPLINGPAMHQDLHVAKPHYSMPPPYSLMFNDVAVYKYHSCAWLKPCHSTRIIQHPLLSEALELFAYIIKKSVLCIHCTPAFKSDNVFCIEGIKLSKLCISGPSSAC